MSRLVRPAALFAALALALAGCASAKSTGLPAGPTPEPVSQTRVQVVDSAYEPVELDVVPGDTVTWLFVGSAPHNVKFVTLEINSHPDCLADTSKCAAKGETFEHEFKDAGEFAYYCVIHGTANGQGMAGKIVVKAA